MAENRDVPALIPVDGLKNAALVSLAIKATP
jgi:hypothetical protein